MKVRLRRDAKGRHKNKFTIILSLATLLLGAAASQIVANLDDPLSPPFLGGVAALGLGLVAAWAYVAITFDG